LCRSVFIPRVGAWSPVWRRYEQAHLCAAHNVRPREIGQPFLAAGALISPDASAEARTDLTARVEIIARFVHPTTLTKQGVLNLD
jgi:hypothetical protein